MKRIILLLLVIFTIISCKKENLPEPMTNYIKISLSNNSEILVDSSKTFIWINNYSNKNINYSAIVKIKLYDTIEKKEYISNINLDAEVYSTHQNSEQISFLSIEKLLNYSKYIEYNKLFWNDGLTLSELPESSYILYLSLFVLEPNNPGNLIQSDPIHIDKLNPTKGVKNSSL